MTTERMGQGFRNFGAMTFSPVPGFADDLRFAMSALKLLPARRRIPEGFGPKSYAPRHNRYSPHQGEQECARRRRHAARISQKKEAMR